MDGAHLARALFVLHNKHLLSKNEQEVVPALRRGGEYRLVNTKFQYNGVSVLAIHRELWDADKGRLSWGWEWRRCWEL